MVDFELKVDVMRGTQVKSSNNMKIGEIGKIQEGISEGFTLMRTYTGWVCLEKPRNTWTAVPGWDGPDFTIEVLPTGSKVQLTL